MVLRPNNFFDLAGIGAGPKKRDTLLEIRSRTNQCPAVDNILRYATIDVPDVDINRDIRWAGECDSASKPVALRTGFDISPVT